MARQRTKRRNWKRKRTMRGGFTPLEIGIGAAVVAAVGLATALYSSSSYDPNSSSVYGDAFTKSNDVNLMNNGFAFGEAPSEY